MKAVLDGVTLPVDCGVQWDLVDGVDPYELWLTLPSDMAQALFAKAQHGQSALTIEVGDQRETWRGLSILGTGPGPTPFEETLQIVDRRWSWKYGPPIRRSYNVTRKSGGVRELRGADDPLAVRQLVEDIAYFSWSLRRSTEARGDLEVSSPGELWTAGEILRDVLDLVAPGEWIDRDGVLSGSAGQFPEARDVEIVALADQAIAQALALTGGRVGLFVRADKQIVLTDRLNGAELGLVSGSSQRTRTRDSSGIPRIVGGALYSQQDRRMERPSAIRVWFAPACELRVDHIEGESLASDTSAPIRCEQVCRYPEDVNVSGRTVYESTWGNLDDYLAFLAGKQAGDLPALTLDLVRRGYLHGLLEAYSYVDSSGLWATRAGAIRRHYRTTYRIGLPYRERIRSWRPYRVAIEDVEAHAQAASPVYQNYAEWPTFRGVTGRTYDDPPALSEQVRNRYAYKVHPGWPIYDTPLRELRQAPALVRPVDEELGIFDVEFVLDSTNTASRYIPSAIRPNRIPSADPTTRYRYLQEGWLTKGHQVSVVITVQPSAPNDMALLHPVDVTPQDLADKLPGQRRADGPVMHVFVPSARELARFAWSDNREPQIRLAFDSQSPVTISEAYGEPINAPVLRSLAEGIAARIYTSLEDHTEGGVLTGFAPGLELQGTARSIRHAISSRGATTQIDLPPEPPKLREEVFLPPSVQKLLGRFADP